MTQMNLSFLIAQWVNNPPAIKEILAWFLDQEDPVEKD